MTGGVAGPPAGLVMVVAGRPGGQTKLVAGEWKLSSLYGGSPQGFLGSRKACLISLLLEACALQLLCEWLYSVLA